MIKNQRQSQRFVVSLPIQLSFGPQITLLGHLKDLSLKSAFVKLKNSIYMEPNDELSFTIDYGSDNAEDRIEGSARISRIDAGEGIAIYFTKMDEGSSTRLQQLVATGS